MVMSLKISKFGQLTKLYTFFIFLAIFLLMLFIAKIFLTPIQVRQAVVAGE